MPAKKYTWGFDLGTNSIGWAVVDAVTGEPIDSGVRVLLAPGKEATAAFRREKRQMRRQKGRKKRKLQALFRLLQKHGMFPKVAEEERHKRLLPEELKQFFLINPYAMRHKALQEPLSLYELGRVFYQLGQRRGFPTDSFVQDAKEAKVMKSEKEAEKLGMHALGTTDELMKKYNTTLGSALWQAEHAQGGGINRPQHQDRISLRRRYTERAWYEKEFNAIWDKQSAYHPHLTEELKKNIQHILFFQRRLKSQAMHIEICTFDKTQRRCPKANIYFESFRFYQTLNNLQVDGKPLTPEDRKTLEAHCKFCVNDKDMAAVAKKLGVDLSQLNFCKEQLLPACTLWYRLKKIFCTAKAKKFSMEELQERLDQIRTSENKKALEKYMAAWQLGEKAKNEVGILRKSLPKQYAQLSSRVIQATLPYLEAELPYNVAILLANLPAAYKRANKPWNEEAQALVIQTVQSNMALFHGSEESMAKAKALLKAEFGLEDKALAVLYHSSYVPPGQLQDKIPANSIADLRNPTVNRVLRELRLIANALVVLHGPPAQIYLEFARELKKGKKALEKLQKEQNIYAAKRFSAKKALEAYIATDPQIAFSSHNILKMQLHEETGGNCVYLTGSKNRVIPLAELFTGRWTIDHIVPQSAAPTSSLFNLALCPDELNIDKGGRTPYQFFKDKPEWEAIKAAAKEDFNAAKYKHFINPNDPAPAFLDKQAHDTAYIAREARQVLQLLCHDVVPVKGAVTALLRSHWKLDHVLLPRVATDLANGSYYVVLDEACKKILDFRLDPILKKGDPEAEYKAWKAVYNSDVGKLKKELGAGKRILKGRVTERYFYPAKVRDDYRHNQLDALVVAVACRSYNHYFNTQSARGIAWAKLEAEPVFDMPNLDFKEQVEAQLAHVLVSFLQKNRHYQRRARYVRGVKCYLPGVRGALHADTPYGRYPDKANPEVYTLHIRKPVAKLTEKNLEDIVDPAVRMQVQEWRKQESVSRGPYPLLCSDSDNPVPVKRVRFVKKASPDSMRQLARGQEMNQWVLFKNNYIAAFYVDKQGKWSEYVVTFQEAIARKRVGKAIVPETHPDPKKGGKVHFTLRQQDYLVLGLSEVEIESMAWKNLSTIELKRIHDHLYRIQILSKGDYAADKHAFISKLSKDTRERLSITKFEKLHAIKVKLNCLGKIIDHQLLYRCD